MRRPRSAIAGKSSTARRTSPSTARTASASASSPSSSSRRSRSKCITDSRALASRGCSTRLIRPAASRSSPTIGCSTRWTPRPCAFELRADGVDEERQVLGVGLEHRAGALVAVLGAVGLNARTRIGRSPRAAAKSNTPGDLGEELLGHGHRLGRVGGQAAQVGGRELAQRRRVLRPPLGDQPISPSRTGATACSLVSVEMPTAVPSCHRTEGAEADPPYRRPWRRWRCWAVGSAG